MITSPDNERVKYARSLGRKRVRDAERRYTLEGLRLIDSAVQAGQQPAFVFYTRALAQTERGSNLLQVLASQNVPLYEVSDRVLALVSDTVTPQGALAVVDMPEPLLERARQAALLLVLDRISDPGNIGTILRTAEATAVEAVLLLEGCADPYSPKVVRSAMGAHFGLAVFPSLSWEDVSQLVTGKRTFLADAQGEHLPWELDWTQPLALIVGNEAHGAGPEARAMAQETVRLPMARAVESLNAAIATAALLFEAQRQRYCC